MLILFPIPRVRKRRYLLGTIADHIGVILGHNEFNLYRVHCALSVNAFEVISTDVRSGQWSMMKQSGACWSFVMSVSVFLILSSLVYEYFSIQLWISITAVNQIGPPGLVWQFSTNKDWKTKLFQWFNLKSCCKITYL